MTKTVTVLSGLIRPLVENRLPDWVEPHFFASKEEALELAPQAEIGWFDMYDKKDMAAVITRGDRAQMAELDLRRGRRHAAGPAARTRHRADQRRRDQRDHHRRICRHGHAHRRQGLPRCRPRAGTPRVADGLAGQGRTVRVEGAAARLWRDRQADRGTAESVRGRRDGSAPLAPQDRARTR